jgi:hypothetical protein
MEIIMNILSIGQGYTAILSQRGQGFPKQGVEQKTRADSSPGTIGVSVNFVCMYVLELKERSCPALTICNRFIRGGIVSKMELLVWEMDFGKDNTQFEQLCSQNDLWREALWSPS